MKYIKRLTDYDYEEGIHRHELWYTKIEYGHMKRANYDAMIRAIWVKASAGVPVSYTGNDDGSDDDECLVGIEHLLTQGCINAVRTCRQRCVDAVLSEQTRQASMPSRWRSVSNIALASFAETRESAIRARKLGKLHRAAI